MPYFYWHCPDSGVFYRFIVPQSPRSGEEKTEDEPTSGRVDLGQDNALHQKSFLGVAAAEARRDQIANEIIAVNQQRHPVAAIKRTDPVSPTVADAVDNVLNRSGSPTKSEKNTIPDNLQNQDRFAYPGEEKIELRRHPSNDDLKAREESSKPNLGFPFQGNFDLNSLRESFGNYNKSEESANSNQNGRHSPREANPFLPQSHRSLPGVHPNFGRSLSHSEGSVPEDIKNISSLQRSPSLGASFHDNNSSSSESSFYNTSSTPGKFTSYTTDPTTGIVKYLPNKEGIFFCHLCSFSGTTRKDFEDHMTCHFEHICPHCDYKSRTEGRLKRHIKDFHTDDPPEGFGSKRNMGRPKVFRCKQCNFETTEKTLFWQHAKTHIKEEKLLQCPRCEFVTEYKHHLEYHLRNHFGSKPFKCNKCNYSCVNKSMLNSHMKSHTNVYQYRCADCTYATKYCHSLKLHLRKYNHKPATVLNNDGSLPQGVDAEASGLSLLQKRGPPRGPRGPRKDKFDPFGGQFPTMLQGLPAMPGFNGGMMPPFWPLMRQYPNGMPAAPPPLVPSSLNSPFPHLSPHAKLNPTSPMPFGLGLGGSNVPLKCNFCSFSAESKQELYRHVMKVHAAENQDLFSIFGISSEALLEEQNRRLAFLKQQMSPVSNPDKPNQYSPGLHVKTEFGVTETSKPSPHSWPHQSPEEPGKNHMENRGVSRYSLPEMSSYQPYLNGGTSPREADAPEGEDIIKQMMNKFGSGPPLERSPNAHTISETARSELTSSFRATHRESPLDLTKPQNLSPEETESRKRKMEEFMGQEMEVTSSGENSVSDLQVQSPRKRSRKGKAFKLDRLCLQLQEKQSDSPMNSENGDESDDFDENDDLHIDPTAEDDTNDVQDGTGSESLHGDENGNEEKEDKEMERDFAENNSEVDVTDNDKPNVVPDDDGEEKVPEKDETYDPSLEQVDPEEFIADINKRKQELPQAVRRGTELAWKILQDTNPGINIPAPENQPANDNLPTNDSPPTHKLLPRPSDFVALAASTPIRNDFPQNWKYECPYCAIAFKDCVIYTMHMGYHGYRDPFKCNMCGYQSRDKVEFFLHIAREAHN
ncbi:hypothetical protein FSP39_021977 [Pinctada imbricata]|uniref:C2H2-type domain-containing protein n=1 Tax=Pinctada imbricata TaxID=66713 RepID=A0AA88Y3K5_PINIB|nr:hypothetical protein FSP39_021977 [Pinctada imbricata]